MKFVESKIGKYLKILLYILYARIMKIQVEKINFFAVIKTWNYDKYLKQNVFKT